MLIEVNGVMVNTKKLVFYMEEWCRFQDIITGYWSTRIQKILAKDMQAVKYIDEVYIEPTEKQASLVWQKITDMYEYGDFVKKLPT